MNYYADHWGVGVAGTRGVLFAGALSSLEGELVLLLLAVLAQAATAEKRAAVWALQGALFLGGRSVLPMTKLPGMLGMHLYLL